MTREFDFQSSATLQQAIRNTIASLHHEATIDRVYRSLSREHRHVMTAILDMEDAGEITRTPSGAYVLGSHAPATEPDLVLTSCDPLYGQPSLF